MLLDVGERFERIVTDDALQVVTGLERVKGSLILRDHDQRLRLTLSLKERSISWVTVALGSALISRMCFSRI